MCETMVHSIYVPAYYINCGWTAHKEHVYILHVSLHKLKILSEVHKRLAKN